ncbi:UNVERIFIED_CONTAM: hypothetical protein GTU68_038446 [Idotea baltica]|nr:hypothetical protein [Idotea baltica]
MPRIQFIRLLARASTLVYLMPQPWLKSLLMPIKKVVKLAVCTR